MNIDAVASERPRGTVASAISAASVQAHLCCCAALILWGKAQTSILDPKKVRFFLSCDAKGMLSGQRSRALWNKSPIPEAIQIGF